MRINPPTLFFLLVAAIAAVDQLLPVVSFAVPWLLWFGAGLVILGIAVSVAGKSHFQRVGTNVYTFEEPGKLVTDGLYRISRNPMYLGLVLAGIGAALVSATLSAVVLAAAFAITVRCWYIAFEENSMRRQFGEAYEAYCQEVGRWAGRQRAGGGTDRG